MLEDLTGAHFYGMYLGGKKIGWAKTEFALVSDGGETRWRSSFEDRIQTLFYGKLETWSNESQWDFDAQEPFALRKVRFFGSNDTYSYKAVLTRQQDGSFLAVIRSGNRTIQKTLPAFEFTLADELSDALWIRQGPKVGDVNHTFGFGKRSRDSKLVFLVLWGIS
ncbi:MAG: hypothetical protein IH991_20095 [Planctomycetes bacterium]|nr:hypothetical protein [Planctomycetota bacterium]